MAFASNTKLKKVLLLHNPTAGASHPPADELLSAMTAAGLSPLYQSVKDGDYKAALRKGWDLVIVAGGDGTVAKAAFGLADRRVPIAILPIGTANNIARSLGIVDSVDKLLKWLPTAQMRCLDVGVAKGPWGKRNFLEAVGCGPIAEAISHSGPKPPEPIRIDIAREDLQKFVQEAEADSFKVAIDGEKFTGEFLLIEILNLSFSGPALPIAFSAVPDDQLLDVVFLFATDRRKMVAWLGENPEQNPPPLTIRRGSKIEFVWNSGHLRIDSEVYLPPETPSKVKIQLEKDSLRVLVP
jgi:diacylglycerol kinase (ATP)